MVDATTDHTSSGVDLTSVSVSRTDGTPALEGRAVLVAWDREQRLGRPISEAEALAERV